MRTSCTLQYVAGKHSRGGACVKSWMVFWRMYAGRLDDVDCFLLTHYGSHVGTGHICIPVRTLRIKKGTSNDDFIQVQGKR
jgi:hypothetical protein